MSPQTVAAALARARQCGVERLDAQLLLARATCQQRSWLIAHEDAPLTDAQATAYATDLARRAAGEPLAYIVGEKEFHGLTLHIDARVLVPRPDTETLVDWALETLAVRLAATLNPRVVDLGAGSGAIALAVKHAFPAAQLTALDASAAALDVARANAERLVLAIELRHSHWWSALAGQRFDVALSNPPYIAQDDPHLAALRHEPLSALASGSDGLASLREIIAAAPAHLCPGGWLLLEHGHDQAVSVQALLLQAGFNQVQSRHDLGGIARCTGGRFDLT